MTETPNLHLTKDADTDYYSVSRVNANSDKIDSFAGEVVTTLGSKVDKVNGKGLSENDYTDSEKTKLAGLSNYDDTALSARTAYNTQMGVKNIVPILCPTSENGGITFTAEADGTISVNGAKTAGQYPRFYITCTSNSDSRTYNNAIPVARGTYKISTPDTDIGSVFYGVRVYPNSTDAYTSYSVYSGSADTTFTVDNDTTRLHMIFGIDATDTFTDAVFKPMIARTDLLAADSSFAPYAPSNRELYEMIRALQTGGGA